MKVKNNTGEDFRLPTGHVIPKRKSSLMPRGILIHKDNAPYIEGLKRSRKIEVNPDKETHSGTTKAKGIKKYTREWFAVAERSELNELAEEVYGIKSVKGETDDELREKLCQMTFLDY